ncbi:hypothetical protein BGY98DRAFT_568712 [Russula aff. rugulosa BPL654]|nr:hypothetical protein BGY98DRAFT_568712 [Russula aff. rugulosa BPL654]
MLHLVSMGLSLRCRLPCKTDKRPVHSTLLLLLLPVSSRAAVMSGLHAVSVMCPRGVLYSVSRNTRVSRSGKSKVKMMCRQENQVQKQVVLTLVPYKFGHHIGQFEKIILSSQTSVRNRRALGGSSTFKNRRKLSWFSKGSRTKRSSEPNF